MTYASMSTGAQSGSQGPDEETILVPQQTWGPKSPCDLSHRPCKICPLLTSLTPSIAPTPPCAPATSAIFLLPLQLCPFLPPGLCACCSLCLGSSTTDSRPVTWHSGPQRGGPHLPAVALCQLLFLAVTTVSLFQSLCVMGVFVSGLLSSPCERRALAHQRELCSSPEKGLAQDPAGGRRRMLCLAQSRSRS